MVIIHLRSTLEGGVGVLAATHELPRAAPATNGTADRPV